MRTELVLYDQTTRLRPNNLGIPKTRVQASLESWIGWRHQGFRHQQHWLKCQTTAQEAALGGRLISTILTPTSTTDNLRRVRPRKEWHVAGRPRYGLVADLFNEKSNSRVYHRPNIVHALKHLHDCLKLGVLRCSNWHSTKLHFQIREGRS